MNNKSKLTDKQWAEIEKRLLEGEAARALAKEFGVSEAAIRKRKGAQVKQIKYVANQIVATELAFRELPIGTQISTQRYAAKLLCISDDMLEGSVHAASNFRRLSAIASTELGKVDVVDPNQSVNVLKGIAFITNLANEAAKTPVNLIAANKEIIKESSKHEGENMPNSPITRQELAESIRSVRDQF
jgi:hypothetical protein